MPRALSRIARSLRVVMSPACAWPSVVPDDDHEGPKLALGVFAFDDDEFGVEAFGVAVLGALEEPVLAGIAGADIHLQTAIVPSGMTSNERCSPAVL